MLGAINSFNSKRNVALCSPGAYSFVGISDSKKKKKKLPIMLCSMKENMKCFKTRLWKSNLNEESGKSLFEKMAFKLRAKVYVRFRQMKYERKNIPDREKNLAYLHSRLKEC